MIGRIVEVADDQRHLSMFRGFMLVQATSGDRSEIGRIPLDDIAAVIANAHGLSYTNNLLVALAERGAPFVLCSANHNPCGMLWPIDGNFNQAKRFDLQIAAGKPLQKRLWAEIVRAKLQQQASVLEAVGQPSNFLHILIRKVRPGDPENIEAQAARRYWATLFGDEFRRDRGALGVNSMLNYGYMVLRSAVARAIIAAGLHPTLGLHHSNEGNAMRLVDDLMEPFRPLLDLKVWRLLNEGEKEVTPETKRQLVRVLFADMNTEIGLTPLSVCAQRLATSLALLYLGERKKLELPRAGLPIDLSLSGSSS